jgi:hypothetical protein
MSRSLTSFPADSSVATISSATGFNAGEYVYLTSSGYIGQPTVNAGSGTTGTYIAGGTTGTFVGGGPVSGGGSLMYGPSNIQATYTGTTIVAGTNKFAPATIATISNNAIGKQANLSNGNIAFTYVSGANIYFQVINDSGTVIVAQTLIASNRSTDAFNNYAICATSVGDRFCVWWQNTTPRTQGAVYTNAGVLVGGATISNNQSTTQSYAASASINGTFFATWYFPSNDLIYFASLTNAGALSSDVVSISNSSGQANAGMQIAPDVESGFSNRVIGQFTNSASDNYGFRLRSDGNSASAVGSFKAQYNTACAIATTYLNGQQYACLVNSNASTTLSAAMWYGGNYASNSGAQTIGSIQAGGRWSSVTPTATGFCVMFINSSGFRSYALGTISGNSISWATAVVVGSVDYTVGNTWQQMAIYSSNGVAVFQNPSGTSLNMQTSYTSGVTNGSTVTGLALTAPTYNFVGVALNSCPAGGSGQVLIRGTAGLNSNYQNIAGAVGYDFTGGGSPVSNRGLVGGRSVTLYGNNK